MVAPGLLLPASPFATPRLPAWAGGLSAALHLLVVLALLLRWTAAPLPAQAPPIEVEMIQQRADVQGSERSSPQPPPSPPSPPAAAEGSLAATKPSPPAKQESKPEVNLGAGLEDQSPLTVSSDNIKPPEPDSRFRNLPPRYPAEAAREHAQGTVQLLVHVTSRGYPSDVQIAQTSGNDSLDAEARRAVQLWRFKPAQSQGRPIPFDYLINIHFSMGGRAQ